VLRDLVRFGALDLPLIARRGFPSESAARQRLLDLTRAGLVERVAWWRSARPVYLPTDRGTHVADVGLSTPGLSAQALRHHLAVAALADWLLSQAPDAEWTTERELRRDDAYAAHARDGRHVLDGTPHVPDGLLLGPTGPTAIEVELSPKSDLDYAAIFRWYALVDLAVRWFVNTQALERRLARLIGRYGLDGPFASVERLPPTVRVPTWRG
jgi:hypothetical protein